MCFSPQRRALFRHQNFEKCSDMTCFVHFHVKMCFSPNRRAISLLSTYLRTRRFNRPTFRLPGHTHHCKNTAFRDFSNIWLGCVFFLLTFALVHLLPSDLTAFSFKSNLIRIIPLKRTFLSPSQVLHFFLHLLQYL